MFTPILLKFSSHLKVYKLLLTILKHPLRVGLDLVSRQGSKSVAAKELSQMNLNTIQCSCAHRLLFLIISF